MPRVPEYNEQFRYAGRADDLGGRLHGGDFSSTASAIGAQGEAEGRGLQQLGVALSKAANVGSAIVDDYNTTKAQQAMNGLQKGFLSWQSEMAKKKGEQGMNAAADYETWHKEQVAELTKGMNTVQRGRFEGMAGVKAAGFQKWASDYGSEQGLVYRNAEDQAGIETETESLAVNLTNVVMAKASEERIRQLSFQIAQRKGLGEEATKAMMRDVLSGAIIPAIAAQIDAGKLSTARTALAHYRGTIGESKALKLDGVIQQEAKRQEAEARAANERARRKQDAAMSLQLFSEHPDDAAGAFAAIDAKYANDPERALEMKNTYRLVRHNNELAEKQVADDNLRDTLAAVDENVKAIGGNVSVYNQFRAGLGDNLPPDQRQKVQDYADKQFEYQLTGNAPVFSDPVSKMNAEEDLLSGRKTINQIRLEYGSKLTIKDLSVLDKTSTDSNEKALKKQRDNIFKSYFYTSSAFLNAKGDERKQIEARYKVEFDKRLDAFKDPTPEDAERIARDLSLTYSVPSQGWFGGTDRIDYFGERFSRKLGRSTTVVVPDNTKEKIRELYKARGKEEPTDEEIALFFSMNPQVR